MTGEEEDLHEIRSTEDDIYEDGQLFHSGYTDIDSYANMDYDKGHLMCRNVIEQNASLWFMGKAIHSRVNVDVAGSFYNGKLVSPGYTSCLLTILGLMPWEILSVEQAIDLIAYGDQWYSEPLGVFTSGPPYIQDWNEDVEILKATRFEPDGHCFHDVALKLVGFFMEENVEDDDEINDSLPKDKEPDYMQSAFRLLNKKLLEGRYGYGEVVKGWKGGEWCRPVMRDVGDALADMVVHVVAMAFRENRGTLWSMVIIGNISV
ncbi:DnaJ homolog subfamily C member 2-like protein [Tanacetum coccineum]